MTACVNTINDAPVSFAPVAASAQVTGAAVARLDIPREVSFLTSQCLAALEAKSQLAPNLSAQGYAPRKDRQEKVGPVLNYNNQLFNSARTVELRYVAGRGKKTNKCYISVRLGADAERSSPAWAKHVRPIITASREAAQSAGYTLLATKKAGRSSRERLKKGGITIRLTGKTEVMGGFRSMQFTFTDLTGTRFAQ